MFLAAFSSASNAELQLLQVQLLIMKNISDQIDWVRLRKEIRRAEITHPINPDLSHLKIHTVKNKHGGIWVILLFIIFIISFIVYTLNS